MDDSSDVAMCFPSPDFGGGWPEGSGGGRAKLFTEAEFCCNFSKFSHAHFLLQHLNPTRPFGAPSPEIRGGKMGLFPYAIALGLTPTRFTHLGQGYHKPRHPREGGDPRGYQFILCAQSFYDGPSIVASCGEY